MEVRLDQLVGLRGFTIPSQPRIWLKDGERNTRTNHALAHEVAHHQIWDQDAEHDLVERACDRFAAALLMPPGEFAASAADLEFDLWRLQRVWRFSSLEAIARRLGEVVPGIVSASWLELETQWRAPRDPEAALAALEREALGAAYLKSRGRAEAKSDAGSAFVWRTRGGAERRALSVCLTAA